MDSQTVFTEGSCEARSVGFLLLHFHTNGKVVTWLKKQIW